MRDIRGNCSNCSMRMMPSGTKMLAGRAEQLDWTSDPDTGRDDRWRGRFKGRETSHSPGV